MNKVLIMGCCGSGKTTLAQHINKLCGLPIISLDQHYFQPGWVETPQIEWQKKVKKLAARPKWVMDGNYKSTLKHRAQEADTIIYLDFSALTCMYRVIRRIYKYRGTVRPHMAAGCAERLDWEFLHYVLTFNIRNRRKNYNFLSQQKTTKTVFILKSQSMVDLYINSLKT